jgi:hypothetical protein
MSIERKSSDRRKLRAGMVFVLVVAGTALIGWGGLAAWQAVTANDGSSFATGGVHMQNVATITYPTGQAPVTCTDQNSPGNCGAIFTVTGAAPGFSAQVGMVQITNTGSLPSTFALSLGSAVTSGAGSTLCGDLTLTITDSTGASVYNGALTNLGTTPNLFKATGSPSTTWNQNDTNTFTFNLALPGSTSTDQDSTCTADFTWTQTQA